MTATGATALALAAAAACALHYRRAVARPPELVYRPTPFLDRVLARCPILTAPYRPPWWASNRHLQLALLAWRDRRTPPLAYEHTETLVLDDGGTVSLDWLGLDDPAAGPTTPTVVVLPTICGDGATMRRTVAALRRRLGWRVVVCNRRGHGTLPLTAPRVSTLGATDDVRRQVARIRERLPAAPLYALGVSAGSGLLVRWLGEDGPTTPLTAAIAYCPGYDTTRAFHRVHRVYGRYMLRGVRAYFAERHAERLADCDGYAALLASATVGEFHDRLYGCAGFPTPAEFHARTNPMAVADAIAIPLLTLNAADDPVCTLANVEEHRGLFTRVPESLLVLTRRGSHCAFLEGHRRPRSWAHRLIAEYFAAVEHARRAG